MERRDKADSPIELKRLDEDFFSEDDWAIRIKLPCTATRRHNGSRSSLLKTHLTPESSIASNRRPGPVRQLSVVHQAKKFGEVGINENLGQGNVVSGATLNDWANDGRRFINPVVHQRDGNWSRARRDQPIDRFDEFFGAGHVNCLRCGFKTALASCVALRGWAVHLASDEVTPQLSHLRCAAHHIGFGSMRPDAAAHDATAHDATAHDAAAQGGALAHVAA
jgi:hypothetical protein